MCLYEPKVSKIEEYVLKFPKLIYLLLFLSPTGAEFLSPTGADQCHSPFLPHHAYS